MTRTRNFLLGAYLDALDEVEPVFRAFEGAVTQPKIVLVHGQPTFRYIEETIAQAVVMKLARLLSGCRSCVELSRLGYLQEQSVLQRMIDDVNEDIVFLCAAVQSSSESPLVKRFVAEFFREEIESTVGGVTAAKKKPTQRRELREFIDSVFGGQPDPKHSKATETISSIYSGFVHGAGSQIMEMYGGRPARFFVRGMPAKTLLLDYADALGNAVYRGLVSFEFAAGMFGDTASHQLVRAQRHAFNTDAGPWYKDTAP